MRLAEASDLAYVDALRKTEGRALGFIPLAVYQLTVTPDFAASRRRWRYQRLWVTTDNGDLTGFVFATFANSTAKIHQIVIQPDARRWYRASLLETQVEREAIRRGCAAIEARVAVDLESNFYWRAMGYTVTATTVSTWLNQRESKSKRPLFFYRKELASLGLTASDTPPQRPDPPPE